MIEKLHSEMKKNVVLCPKCGSEMRPDTEQAEDGDFAVWVCLNCGYTRKRCGKPYDESKLEGSK
jgi:transposase-like protein